MRKELLHTLEHMKDIKVMIKFIRRQLHDEIFNLEEYIKYLSKDAQNRWNFALTEALSWK